MRHEPVDAGDLDPGIGGGGGHRLGDIHHGMAEHLVALHPELAHLTVGGWPTIHIEEVLLGPVGAQGKAQQAAIGRGPLAGHRLDDDRAGPVAEQHAGPPVAPVHQPRHGLRADHQGALRPAPRGEPIGHRQRVDEARTDRLDIEGNAHGATQLALNDGGDRRKDQIGGGGRDDDQVDVVGGPAGGLQSPARGGHGQVRDRLIVGGLMALADTCALDDPGIGCVDELGQVVVGHHALGQIPADAGHHAAQDLRHAEAPGGAAACRAASSIGAGSTSASASGSRRMVRSISAAKSLPARSTAN